MNRRSFLGAILAAGVAPAVVRAESLMRVKVATDAEVWQYGTPRFMGWIGRRNHLFNGEVGQGYGIVDVQAEVNRGVHL